MTEYQRQMYDFTNSSLDLLLTWSLKISLIREIKRNRAKAGKWDDATRTQNLRTSFSQSQTIFFFAKIVSDSIKLLSRRSDERRMILSDKNWTKRKEKRQKRIKINPLRKRISFSIENHRLKYIYPWETLQFNSKTIKIIQSNRPILFHSDPRQNLVESVVLSSPVRLVSSSPASSSLDMRRTSHKSRILLWWVKVKKWFTSDAKLWITF